MKHVNKCENCIWFDQCHEEEACDYYSPVSFDEQEATDIEEYEKDLRVRHEIYMEQVYEQNS